MQSEKKCIKDFFQKIKKYGPICWASESKINKILQ